MSTEPHVYTKDSPWPNASAGTIAVVHYGDYRRQEIWVLCGSNVGNWYPLGNQYGNRALNDPTVPQHPHWDDIVARGPVTILAATSQEAYRSGWADGRRNLFEQVEQEYEWGPSGTEDATPAQVRP